MNVTNSNAGRPGGQRGMATIFITLVVLLIITLMVLFSVNVGFFEQKTATNENRGRIAQQAAEYANNLAGEFLKANRAKIISNLTAEGGWLAPSTAAKWAKCADVGTVDAFALDSEFSTGHPCLSEPDPPRRAQLYFYTSNGAVGGSQLLPYTSVIPATAQVEAVAGLGGTAGFAATANVRALLCRLDTSVPTNVKCALNPVAGNRVALTLISDASLTNEDGAAAEVKETWATYSTFVPSAAVPLIASGVVQGVGNGNIVANADSKGDGSNVMASIWSPNNVSDSGSFITCQFAEFTNQLSSEMTMAQVKTTCPSATGSAPPCNCPSAPDENETPKEDYSGHKTGGGAVFHKGSDILDVQAVEPICNSTINTITPGCRTLPSITFFPGRNAGGTAMDDPAVTTDDSMFEYVFGVDYEHANPGTGNTLTNCGSSGTQNCVSYAMLEQFEAVTKTCANLESAAAATYSGVIYVDEDCTSLSTQIGSPTSPAIVVINKHNSTSTLLLKNGMVMYGMLFIHSDNNTAEVHGTGKNLIYGALVVEGNIEMTGQFTVVYDSTSADSNTNKIPSNAKFGRVPGSWLDAKSAF